MKNIIGLDSVKAKELTQSLNDLLANYQLYYQNLRSFHWNVVGPEFFELHEKFEELYNSANEAIDELAERVLTLGDTPLHTWSEYLRVSEIKESQGIKDGKECVSIVLENIKVLLVKEREILSVASDIEDEGTSALMSDYIKEKEKVSWMLSAYLK
ncbi:Dps family protein [Aureibacter tunicatorum]|uniref:Starvation-inducible DNA-binding protein n=1 Tax=Aureibacter tunicatorum TaxID=866807 RepID=A0AAE3XPK4_9BACT|nr:DNA starvation/stationary phase protection protein [Aureibacter tunicatorum]MDR6239700.1 starvation-inducible DNA-binding protein [Aureibacter tunicatorum]BDD04176.1 DNA starvation/stationary phase protection protein [Aureibacter tunicatorum]